MGRSAISEAQGEESGDSEEEMNTIHRERIDTLIEFVQRQHTTDRRLFERAFSDLEVALYRTLGLPDNAVTNFVKRRSQFPNNAARIKFIKARYGIDLSSAPRTNIVQLTTAVIYRHGDFEALKKEFPSTSEEKQSAWSRLPVWDILHERAVEAGGRINPAWRDILTSYILNDLRGDSERRAFLTGILPPSKLKRKNIEKMLPEVFERLKKSNSIGL